MIRVVGVSGEALPAGALADATVVAGSRRLLEAAGALLAPGPATIEIGGDVGAAVDAIASAHRAGATVCVLASGDPGWFGVLRSLLEAVDAGDLEVWPAASSVSEAFARLRLPWDDATVVSAHGRPLPDAARLAARSPKVAVLTAPDTPPEALGRALIDLGAVHEHAAVCSRLGMKGEQVDRTDLGGLAAGTWDPLSVVVLWSGTGVAAAKSSSWGRPEQRFAHRAGMVTKSEVRAVALGLLSLPAPTTPAPVLWDVGAGSGSVGIECAAAAPWLEVVAVERDREMAAMCAANARDAEVAVRVVQDTAPACLGELPDPARVFVGGGGLEVVDAAWRRLGAGGVLVAAFAAMDRAAAAGSLLGHLTQVAASRGRLLPDGGWRLEATNPVFIAWGERP